MPEENDNYLDELREYILNQWCLDDMDLDRDGAETQIDFILYLMGTTCCFQCMVEMILDVSRLHDKFDEEHGGN